MTYSPDFLALQLQFAEHIRQISRTALPASLLQYTNLYRRFTGVAPYDPVSPIWANYLKGLDTDVDVYDWTARYYQMCSSDSRESAASQRSFGSFSYQILHGNQIRIHFKSIEPDDHSPLAHDRIDVRRSELKSMFEDIRANVTTPIEVLGVSWLYNLKAYCRLFPVAYISTAQRTELRYHSMTLWGQFVDRHGQVRPEPRRRFLSCLQRHRDLKTIGECFPLQPLIVRASVEAFYHEFGLA